MAVVANADTMSTEEFVKKDPGQIATVLPEQSKPGKVIDLIKKCTARLPGANGKVVVFCNKAQRVKELVDILQAEDLKIHILGVHEDLDTVERDRVLNLFFESDASCLAVSDPAMLRYEHAAHVRYIVNYDAPGDLQSYTDRLACKGHPYWGFAVTFLQPHDGKIATWLLEVFKQTEPTSSPSLKILTNLADTDCGEEVCLELEARRHSQTSKALEAEVSDGFESAGERRAAVCHLHGKFLRRLKKGARQSKLDWVSSGASDDSADTVDDITWRLEKDEQLIKELVAELEEHQAKAMNVVNEYKQREMVLRQQQAILAEQVARNEERMRRECEYLVAWGTVATLPCHPNRIALQRLPADDLVFKLFGALFANSCTTHRVDPFSTTTCPAPLLRVEEMHVVANADLAQEYHRVSQELQSLRPAGCTCISSLEHLKLPTRKSCSPLNVELNEHFLFYEAPPDAIDVICRAGFTPKVGGWSGKGSFGNACYFQVNASKSDLSITEHLTGSTSRQTKRPNKKIILARVLLGEPYRAKGPLRKAVGPPRGGDGHALDSVLAEARVDGGVGDHAEVMIYNRFQAYPEVVITYVHDENCTCVSCMRSPVSV